MESVWILGDQRSPEHAALAQTNPRQSRVVIVESKAPSTRGLAQTDANKEPVRESARAFLIEHVPA